MLGPDSSASWTLQRHIGVQRAMDMTLSARPINAIDAERIGLIARCVSDEQFLPEAMELAKLLASKSPEAACVFKTRVRGAATANIGDALDAERDSQSDLGKTIAYREAVLRFSRLT